MMYQIIGADQKAYGPVTSDQIRQWIKEGRVNGQTQIQVEGTVEWQPLSALPEFADAPGVGLSAPPPLAAAGTRAALSTDELLARDYTLDFGSCFTRSWQLIKKNFWPVVGITFLIFLIVDAISQALGLISGPAVRAIVLERRITPGGAFLIFITSVLSMPASAVLLGGLFRYYLKLIRGETATIGDAFSGFSSGFGPLLLVGLVQGALTYLGFLFFIIPGIYLCVAWYFAIPLISDKGMDFWQAMELSRKIVSKHWFLVFGFLLVMGLVMASGIIACCIGIVVTVPIGFVALMYAYEDIFHPQTA